jgi:DNA primase large subunit
MSHVINIEHGIRLDEYIYFNSHSDNCAAFFFKNESRWAEKRHILSTDPTEYQEYNVKTRGKYRKCKIIHLRYDLIENYIKDVTTGVKIRKFDPFNRFSTVRLNDHKTIKECIETLPTPDETTTPRIILYTYESKIIGHVKYPDVVTQSHTGSNFTFSLSDVIKKGAYKASVTHYKVESSCSVNIDIGEFNLGWCNDETMLKRLSIILYRASENDTITFKHLAVDSNLRSICIYASMLHDIVTRSRGQFYRHYCQQEADYIKHKLPVETLIKHYLPKNSVIVESYIECPPEARYNTHVDDKYMIRIPFEQALKFIKQRTAVLSNGYVYIHLSQVKEIVFEAVFNKLYLPDRLAFLANLFSNTENDNYIQRHAFKQMYYCVMTPFRQLSKEWDIGTTITQTVNNQPGITACIEKIIKGQQGTYNERIILWSFLKGVGAGIECAILMTDRLTTQDKKGIMKGVEDFFKSKKEYSVGCSRINEHGYCPYDGNAALCSEIHKTEYLTVPPSPIHMSKDGKKFNIVLHTLTGKLNKKESD